MIVRPGRSGDDDDHGNVLDVRPGGDLLQDDVPADEGKREIEEHERYVVRVEYPQSIETIAGFEDSIALERERSSETSVGGRDHHRR